MKPQLSHCMIEIDMLCFGFTRLLSIKGLHAKSFHETRIAILKDHLCEEVLLEAKANCKA